MPNLINYPTIWPQFFTASVQQHFHLLQEDRYKDILITALNFLVDDKRVDLSAFVIMSNYVHIIWQPLQNYTLTNIQASFMRHTAKHILKKLEKENPLVKEQLKVNKYDRDYQVWKREPLSIELYNEKALLQKLEYIHNNPVIAKLEALPEDYKYSSARFYETGFDEFNIVTHDTGN